MGHLTTRQKEEVLARLFSFDFSGFKVKLSRDISRHYKSFVGRDFKSFAQLALFILGPYLSAEQKIVWLSLSKVSYFLDYDSLKDTANGLFVVCVLSSVYM